MLIVSEYPPYQTNLFSLVVETVSAMLRQGAAVTLWMCGLATVTCNEGTGTETSALLCLDKSRPPTMKGILAAMREQFGADLTVVGCAECSGECGYSVDRELFRTGYLSHYARYLNAADKIYYVGRA